MAGMPSWDSSTPWVTRILIARGEEVVVGQCSHQRWCFLTSADGAEEAASAACLALCASDSCIQLAMSWWRAYNDNGQQGVWALCEDHSAAVLLHGVLDASTLKLHTKCAAPACRASAIRLGDLPPPDVSRLHQPRLGPGLD